MQSREMVSKIVTKKEMLRQLRELGVTEGMILEVHSSMKSLGYVVGGAQTIVDSLLEAVGYDGTLVMPIQAWENSEPSYWENPPVDRSLWEEVRSSIPAFRADQSEYSGMGAVINNFNRRTGVYRSSHPKAAFAAYGRYGKLITHKHDLDFSLGLNSPLGEMYKLPAYILLMGVDYDRCTSMHLGEVISGIRPVIMEGGATEDNGIRKWNQYLDLEYDSDEFIEIGHAMEAASLVRLGKIADSTCRLMKFKETVDFTADYLRKRHIV